MSLLAGTHCVSKATEFAIEAISQSETFQALCTDKADRIWLTEWNPEWIDRRPLDPDTSEPFDTFPLVIIDSLRHHIDVRGENGPLLEHGELSVYVGVQVPEFYDDKPVLRHSINCARYILNAVGGTLSDAARWCAQNAVAVPEIARVGGQSNDEEEWNDPNIGRYHWELYSWQWGWQ